MIKDAIPHFDELSPSEKMLLMEELWDDFAGKPTDVPVYNWQKGELERRYREYLASPTEGSSWAEARERLLAALR
jgi:putative addiction module component (TIGR02574 family)